MFRKVQYPEQYRAEAEACFFPETRSVIGCGLGTKNAHYSQIKFELGFRRIMQTRRILGRV